MKKKACACFGRLSCFGFVKDAGTRYMLFGCPHKFGNVCDAIRAATASLPNLVSQPEPGKPVGRAPARAAGEFSSPGFTFFADSHLVSAPPRVTAVACKSLRPFCQKCRWNVTPEHTYTLDPTKSEWAGCAVQV